MAPREKVVAFLAMIASLLLCTPAFSADRKETTTPVIPVSSEPDVLLSLLDAEDKATIGQGLRLQVTVISGSSAGGIGVDSVEIEWPSRLLLRDPEISTIHRKTSIVGEGFELQPGFRRELPPLELRSNLMSELSSEIWSLLVYKPRKEAITATLSYRSLSTGTESTKIAKLLIPVRAHPLGMYAGGVVGTLLAALFLVLPIVKSTQNGVAGNAPQAPPTETLKDRARAFVVRFLRGVVVTGIVILTLQTTSDLALPINIVIQDFYGGVILGLFGDKVAEALQKWIWG